jgi:hypothetical protein
MKSLVCLISGILKPFFKLPLPVSAMEKGLENRREEQEAVGFIVRKRAWIVSFGICAFVLYKEKIATMNAVCGPSILALVPFRSSTG